MHACPALPCRPLPCPALPCRATRRATRPTLPCHRPCVPAEMVVRSPVGPTLASLRLVCCKDGSCALHVCRFALVHVVCCMLSVPLPHVVCCTPSSRAVACACQHFDAKAAAGGAGSVSHRRCLGRARPSTRITGMSNFAGRVGSVECRALPRRARPDLLRCNSTAVSVAS